MAIMAAAKLQQCQQSAVVARHILLIEYYGVQWQAFKRRTRTSQSYIILLIIV